MIKPRVKKCNHCGHEGESWFLDYCGAWECSHCGSHIGLARCYCGWAADGGDGRRQLEDMGETIGEPGEGFFD